MRWRRNSQLQWRVRIGISPISLADICIHTDIRHLAGFTYSVVWQSIAIRRLLRQAIAMPTDSAHILLPQRNSSHQQRRDDQRRQEIRDAQIYKSSRKLVYLLNACEKGG